MPPTRGDMFVHVVGAFSDAPFFRMTLRSFSTEKASPHHRQSVSPVAEFGRALMLVHTELADLPLLLVRLPLRPNVSIHPTFASRSELIVVPQRPHLHPPLPPSTLLSTVLVLRLPPALHPHLSQPPRSMALPLLLARRFLPGPLQRETATSLLHPLLPSLPSFLTDRSSRSSTSKSRCRLSMSTLS